MSGEVAEQSRPQAEVAKQPRLIGSTRFALTITLMIGLSLYYAMRVDMSVAILCMVNHTELGQMEAESINQTMLQLNQTAVTAIEPINPKCVRNNASTSSGKSGSEDGPYVWDNLVQNQILGAFFFGYLCLQIPGGWLAGLIGSRWVIFACMFALSVFTLLLPLVASSWVAVVAFRIFQGLASGAVCPAVQAMIAQWAPPVERATFTTISFSGLQLASIYAFPASGLLCRYVSWQTVFYCWGGLGIAWLFVWFFIGYSNPSQHPRISSTERKYIVNAIREELGDVGQGNSKKKKKRNNKKKMSVPWLDFLKSPPVWACLVGHYASDWGAYTFLSQTPRYLKSVHHFDIASNSTMSALPYIGYWIFIVISGPLADFLEKGRIGRLWTRRLLAIVGYMLPTGLLIIIGYLPCEYWHFALIILIFIVATPGLQYATWPVSYFDIAPKYVGLLFGISNTIACSSGILTNAIAGYVMSVNPTLSEWRLLFFITAGVTAFGCLVYCIFVKAEIEEWAAEKSGGRHEKEEVVPLRVTHFSYRYS